MDRVRPESQGFDTDRLHRIDAFLNERYVSAERLPHAQILIARDGEVVHFASMGKARAEGTPLKPDALFRIASMTKPLTAIAYMMLLEEGLSALDDPVTRVIPEFEGLGVYAGGGGSAPFFPTRACAPMRMIDLLRHTSGLTYGFQNRTSVDAAYRERGLEPHRLKGDNDSFVAGLARVPLEFAPGTVWNYSVSSDVMGVVVARLSGLSLEAFFRTRILEPLGMPDTSFDCSEVKRPRLTDAWMRQGSGELTVVDRAEESHWLPPGTFYSGGGGLLSTTADYHRFCSMLLNGGALEGARILSPKTLELMTANHLPLGKELPEMSRALFSEPQFAGTGYGLGFAITTDPVRALVPGTAGTYWWGGMYSTEFFVDPAERLSTVFMTQLLPSGSYPLHRELRTLIYSALTRSRAR